MSRRWMLLKKNVSQWCVDITPPRNSCHLPRSLNLQGAILQHSIGRSGAIGISSLVIVAFVLQAVAQLQASSRFVFAIARDQALPYSDFLKQTSRQRMPLHATWLVSLLTVPLAFALWRSPVMYSTVFSLGGGTLCLLSYVSRASAVYEGYTLNPSMSS
jgi:amino acid transporter